MEIRISPKFPLVFTVFTARCYAERGYEVVYVVSPSVRLTTTVVDVEVRFSHCLEYFENNFQ